jgi:hypothetical protein
MGRPAHELIFKIFRSKNGYLHKKQLSGNSACLRVIQNSPNWDLSNIRESTRRVGGRTYKVFKLSPSLFNNSILTAQNDTHATQVAYLGSADDQGVDIESPACENSRNAR